MTFNCLKCGAPGQVFDGQTTYGCMCRFTTYVMTESGLRPACELTEADVRRIVREEIHAPQHRGDPHET